jgi:hypothetical protein
MLWCWMDMLADEYFGPGHFRCVDRGVPDGVWWRRPGPRLDRRHALCEPCVSRRGLCPPVCGRQSRAELHIQDIGPRMLPHARAPRRQASCTHPCCSFPICSALRAHGTLHSPTPIGPGPPARGCPLFGYFAPAARIGAEESLGHRDGAQAREKPGRCSSEGGEVRPA